MGIGIGGINLVVLVGYNIIMIFIYRAKHPFFEQYRINPVRSPYYLRNLGLGK